VGHLLGSADGGAVVGSGVGDPDGATEGSPVPARRRHGQLAFSVALRVVHSAVAVINTAFVLMLAGCPSCQFVKLEVHDEYHWP
jgi:hypothetical protein